MSHSTELMQALLMIMGKNKIPHMMEELNKNYKSQFMNQPSYWLREECLLY